MLRKVPILSIFLSTLSLRRATRKIRFVAPDVSSISIHALLAESDYQDKLSLPPAKNFYPRSPCGERLQLVGGVAGCVVISIHALLAESDTC